MQTADHCKVLSAGQTGFRPHHSSSVQEKTPNLYCEAPTFIPTNNVKTSRERLSDVQSHRRVSAVYFLYCHRVSNQATVGYPQGYLVWDAAMSRGICPRVTSCGPFWILPAVILALNVIDAGAYSCHEVRTAFQLRQVGPLHRVPETPGTGEAVGLAHTHIDTHFITASNSFDN